MFSTQHLSIDIDSCQLLAHETRAESAFCNSDSSTGPITFTYNLTSLAMLKWQFSAFLSTVRYFPAWTNVNGTV